MVFWTENMTLWPSLITIMIIISLLFVCVNVPAVQKSLGAFRHSGSSLPLFCRLIVFTVVMVCLWGMFDRFMLTFTTPKLSTGCLVVVHGDECTVYTLSFIKLELILDFGIINLVCLCH